MQADIFSADRIKTVAAIAEHGSFSGAATELGITQPSISQQINKLERDLGQQIFDRTTRRLSLTPAGEAFLLFARAIRQIDGAARLHFTQAKATSVLRIGAVDEFIRIRLTHVLAIFFKEFANCEIHVTSDASARLLSDFETGAYDFVIADSFPPCKGQLLRRFAVKWVGREPLYDAGQAVPLVLAPPGAPMREVALAALRAVGRPWHVRFESASLSAREAAVRSGIGMSVTSGPLPLVGMVDLDGRCGLPVMPELDLFMMELAPRFREDEAARTMRSVIRTVFEELSRAPYPVR